MYTTPEVTKLSSSLGAIQSQGQKVQASVMDSPLFHVATPGAYEADE
jgi:hypothetical protein